MHPLLETHAFDPRYPDDPEDHQPPDSMTDTPRTDAVHTSSIPNICDHPQAVYTVPVEFARELEREAAEWKAEAQLMREQFEEQGVHMATLETLRLQHEAGQKVRIEAMKNALRTINADFRREGRSISNYSDGEYTQDYTTRVEMIERALSL